MVDERKMRVLRAIVTDYVSTREPVGSKALVDRHNLGVSPATVRNDMASLEDEGYIAQPHTSAGRIPTDKGYRLFVDKLANIKPLSIAERRAIQVFLSGAVDIDDIVSRTVRLLAQITQQVAIVQYPIQSNTTIRHVELVSLTTDRVLLIVINSLGRVEQRAIELPGHDETDLAALKHSLNEAVVSRTPADAAAELGLLSDRPAPPEVQFRTRIGVTALLEVLSSEPTMRVAVAGVPNLTRFGDFTTTVQPVLEALEEQVVLLRLLGEASTGDTLTVKIGQENEYEPLQSTSLVAAAYGNHDDVWAGLGIMGPTRMDYPSTMASVRAVARYVGRFLTEG